MLSCNTDDTIYEVGSDFIENDIQVRVIDTFSVNTGTFKLDSLVTSSTNRLLVGSLIKDDFGKLSAKSYLELVASSYAISNDAVYDSIGMILNYDNYYYGDTTKVQTYNLHRINETVEPEDDVSFYNTSSLSYDEQSLGKISFTPKPNKSTDSLFIKMDDVLGEEIFEKIVDNDINTTDDFLQYFKGLAIVPDTTLDSHILGFATYPTGAVNENSSMRLYYTIKDDDSEDNSYFVDFVISSASQQFNQLETDLSNTNLVGFEDEEEIKTSVDTNNLTYTQGGTGITTRIEIPSIKKILEISTNSTVLSAELTFSPLKISYNQYNPLPEVLLVYVVDHKNRFIKELYDIDGNNSYAILNEDDNEFNDSNYYTIDLSGFVDEILYTDYNLNYALMIQYADYNKSVNSLIIEDDANTNNEVKLTLKYLNY